MYASLLFPIRAACPAYLIYSNFTAHTTTLLVIQSSLLTPFSAEFKNKWRHIATSTVYRYDVDRDYVTFYFLIVCFEVVTALDMEIGLLVDQYFALKTGADISTETSTFSRIEKFLNK
jgi:hypothetical protein